MKIIYSSTRALTSDLEENLFKKYLLPINLRKILISPTAYKLFVFDVYASIKRIKIYAKCRIKHIAQDNFIHLSAPFLDQF